MNFKLLFLKHVIQESLLYLSDNSLIFLEAKLQPNSYMKQAQAATNKPFHYQSIYPLYLPLIDQKMSENWEKVTSTNLFFWPTNSPKLSVIINAHRKQQIINLSINLTNCSSICYSKWRLTKLPSSSLWRICTQRPREKTRKRERQQPDRPADSRRGKEVERERESPWGSCAKTQMCLPEHLVKLADIPTVLMD